MQLGTNMFYRWTPEVMFLFGILVTFDLENQFNISAIHLPPPCDIFFCHTANAMRAGLYLSDRGWQCAALYFHRTEFNSYFFKSWPCSPKISQETREHCWNPVFTCWIPILTSDQQCPSIEGIQFGMVLLWFITGSRYRYPGWWSVGRWLWCWSFSTHGTRGICRTGFGKSCGGGWSWWLMPANVRWKHLVW